MDQITINSPLSGQFSGTLLPVQLIDDLGRPLGHFVPHVVAKLDNCPYSPSELAAMQAEQGGRSLSDIWASLGAK